MSKRSDAFKAFKQNIEEHRRIKRVIGRCIASIDDIACGSQHIISDIRGLLARVDKQLDTK
jgi:hypothetical protein